MFEKISMPEHIFLFGHRKQHGKDTCCDIAEDILQAHNVDYCRTFFAKRLKEMAAEEYNLDINRMEDDEYKSSSPKHLNGKTVRDILIEIGGRERAKDPDCWSGFATNEIIESGAKVGLISDFRFPNEAACIPVVCAKYFSKNVIEGKKLGASMNVPMIHKVLVHRPTGKFVSDGADDQLPDIDPYWDHVIINEDTSKSWRNALGKKVDEILRSCLDL